jgi:hypothetical protein
MANFIALTRAISENSRAKFLLAKSSDDEQVSLGVLGSGGPPIHADVVLVQHQGFDDCQTPRSNRNMIDTIYTDTKSIAVAHS